MSTNPFAGLNNYDKMIEGRTRILTCLHKIGAEESFVGLLELQKRYLTDYCRDGSSFLNKDELRRLFAKSSLNQVFSTYMKEDVELRTDPDQTGSLFLKMRRPLNEALDDPPVNNHVPRFGIGREFEVKNPNLVPLPLTRIRSRSAPKKPSKWNAPVLEDREPPMAFARNKKLQEDEDTAIIWDREGEQPQHSNNIRPAAKEPLKKMVEKPKPKLPAASYGLYSDNEEDDESDDDFGGDVLEANNRILGNKVTESVEANKEQKSKIYVASHPDKYINAVKKKRQQEEKEKEMAKIKRYEELKKQMEQMEEELEEENVNDEEYDDEEDEFEGLNEEEEKAEAKDKKERQIETIQKALLPTEESRKQSSAAAEYNGNKHRQMLKMTVGKKVAASTALPPFVIQSDEEEEDDEKEVENNPPTPLYKTIMENKKRQQQQKPKEASPASSPETLQMDAKMHEEYAKEVRGDVNVNGPVVNGTCPKMSETLRCEMIGYFNVYVNGNQGLLASQLHTQMLNNPNYSNNFKSEADLVQFVLENCDGQIEVGTMKKVRPNGNVELLRPNGNMEMFLSPCADESGKSRCVKFIQKVGKTLDDERMGKTSSKNGH